METKELRHWLYNNMRKAEAECKLCKKENEYESGRYYGMQMAFDSVLRHIPYNHQSDREPFGFRAPYGSCTGNAVVRGVLDFIKALHGNNRTIEEFMTDCDNIYPTIVAFVEGKGYRLSGQYKKYSGMKDKDGEDPYEKITADFPVPITEKAIAEFGFYPGGHSVGACYSFHSYYLIKREAMEDSEARTLLPDAFVQACCYDWVILHETTELDTLESKYALEVGHHNGSTFSGEVETMYEVLMALRLCRVPLPLERIRN